MVLVGVLLLRIAGRKSISQMTIAQTVIMISIGSIIIQPIIEHSIVKTIIASAIFIAGLVLMEFLQVRFNFIERFLTGKSKIVIENGVVQTNMLRKLRFTVDQLEMRLRQQGITRFEDVKIATLEPNGQLGYELTREAKPVTIGDLEKMLPQLIVQLQQQQNSPGPLFKEVQNHQHEDPHPNRLN
ncbi:DUF421 domain-containing protein [Bacillus sp. 31A1R]|uniref:DUF421 domain-containing protein n=1 Tax=Robertmurraya mangrovi TaxID=3098077 RepID=A0ABU5J319_9BACI|nr:YetF domain-containing protein [Bacillus sp. 31A1R]MDZ5473799.1 DUF421 domain-containing protein [Bacillus sp. 31A1R]